MKEEAGGEEKKELFIGNLSFNIDEDALNTHFEKYGEIIKIKVLMRPDGSSKGLAFLEFANAKDCTKALAENGK